MIFTDIRNGDITIREIVCKKEGRALLEREFPKAAKSPFFALAQKMTLNAALKRFGGGLSQERIERIRESLEKI